MTKNKHGEWRFRQLLIWRRKSDGTHFLSRPLIKAVPCLKTFQLNSKKMTWWRSKTSQAKPASHTKPTARSIHHQRKKQRHSSTHFQHCFCAGIHHGLASPPEAFHHAHFVAHLYKNNRVLAVKEVGLDPWVCKGVVSCRCEKALWWGYSRWWYIRNKVD